MYDDVPRDESDVRVSMTHNDGGPLTGAIYMAYNDTRLVSSACSKNRNNIYVKANYLTIMRGCLYMHGSITS